MGLAIPGETAGGYLTCSRLPPGHIARAGGCWHTRNVALFKRRKRHAAWDRGSTREDIKHLQEFTESRRGVEAYLEPVTMATETTVVLVAHDGEWTRRRVETPEEAHDLARKWGIPIYDTQKVGYPPRMREWTQRNKEQRGTL